MTLKGPWSNLRLALTTSLTCDNAANLPYQIFVFNSQLTQLE